MDIPLKGVLLKTSRDGVYRPTEMGILFNCQTQIYGLVHDVSQFHFLKINCTFTQVKNIDIDNSSLSSA